MCGDVANLSLPTWWRFCLPFFSLREAHVVQFLVFEWLELWEQFRSSRRIEAIPSIFCCIYCPKPLQREPIYVLDAVFLGKSGLVFALTLSFLASPRKGNCPVAVSFFSCHIGFRIRMMSAVVTSAMGVLPMTGDA